MSRHVRNFLAVAFALVLWPGAAAQAQVPPEQDNHAFRLVLSQFNLHPLASMKELSEEDPKTAILIVFGGKGERAQIPPELRSFVTNGGAVLFATDRATRGALYEAFGIRVTGELLEAGAEGQRYGDSPECPVVVPVRSPQAAMFETRWPIATNRPSFLRNSGRLPELAWIVGKSESRHVPLPYPFVIGGNIGEGRMLVLADHSIFINGMMLPADLENGNMQFAFNCVKWLNQDGQRDRVLFVDEGKVVSNFDVPLQTLPELPVGPVELANIAIAAAENENLFNRFILEQFGRSRVLRGWLIGLTAAALMYGMYRLMRGGYRQDAKVPLVSQNSAKPQAALVDQRRQAQIADGNYAEAARDLARATLADLGYEPTGSPTAESLSMQTNAWWPERGVLTKRVRMMWKIGYGKHHRPVSRRQLSRLHRYAVELANAGMERRLVLGSNVDPRIDSALRT